MKTAAAEDKQSNMRLRATVHGIVQGVGFRYHMVTLAQELSLTGWVANRWNRTVETVAEGPRDTLRQFHSFLQKGPPAARVQRVDVDWQQATGEFSRFTIRHER